MLASLFRPKARRGQIDPADFSTRFTPENSPWFRAASRRTPGRTRGNGGGSDEDAPELQDVEEDLEEWIRDEDGEEDEPVESTPLLPIFSASHLGMESAAMDFSKS